MDRPPKHIRRLLREHVSLAHETELRRALLPLADDFDRWRRGEIDSFELNHHIHRFHDGASRDLFKAYNRGYAEMSVAYAIHTGVLDRDRVPPELLEYLARHLDFYREEDRLESEPNVTDEDESGTANADVLDERSHH